MRCIHEAKLHSHNTMITLTYSDGNLPKFGSLRKRDFQLFMKRLRKHARKRLRVYPCGEYGERFKRPHYHACIFGYDFPDKTPVRVTVDGTHYTSDILSKIWGKGRVECTDVNFKTAAYVARYILKKKTGKAALGYTVFDKKTGEILGEREAEFSSLMSRKPGIGREWLEQYRRDVYPYGHVIINGKSCQPPKYYDNVHELLYPDEIKKLKKTRLVKISKVNNTTIRLAAREKLQKLKLKQLKRSYEDENFCDLRQQGKSLHEAHFFQNNRRISKKFHGRS